MSFRKEVPASPLLGGGMFLFISAIPEFMARLSVIINSFSETLFSGLTASV